MAHSVRSRWIRETVRQAIKCIGEFKATDRSASTMDQELGQKEQRIQEVQERRKQGEVHLPHEIGVVFSDKTRRNNKRVHSPHEIGVISDMTRRNKEKGTRVHGKQRKAERKSNGKIVILVISQDHFVSGQRRYEPDLYSLYKARITCNQYIVLYSILT